MLSLKIVKLKNEFILNQLFLEEALLRADDENWCLINQGSPPAIVLGISSKKEELLDLSLLAEKPIPLIRRFSGGGTVVVDENTFFVTFIMGKTVEVAMQPQAIMQWTEKLYKPVFSGFTLRENDYVWGDKKFGGNAQYLRKERFLHHTTFLWDFDAEKMAYLHNPQKAPLYRQKRSHGEFLCTLRPHFPSQEALLDQLLLSLKNHFSVEEIKKEELTSLLQRPHRKSTTLLF